MSNPARRPGWRPRDHSQPSENKERCSRDRGRYNFDHGHGALTGKCNGPSSKSLTPPTRAVCLLLIGGNALILLGYIRNTIDVDLLVEADRRTAWLDLMRDIGYRLFHGTGAFAQFEPGTAGEPAVDLMFVDAATWGKMRADARLSEAASRTVFTPRAEHLVALKLHAASSPTRGKPETDWEDIRQIMRICDLSAKEPEFRALVLRYGGQKALDRIESFPR